MIKFFVLLVFCLPLFSQTFEIGVVGGDQAGGSTYGYTYIENSYPSDQSGTITEITVVPMNFALNDTVNFFTCYQISPGVFAIRDTVSFLITGDAGSQIVVSDLSVEYVAGDDYGIYNGPNNGLNMRLERSTNMGGLDTWFLFGDQRPAMLSGSVDFGSVGATGATFELYATGFSSTQSPRHFRSFQTFKGF